MKKAIQLRDITESDLPIFFEQQLDPDANDMAAFPARKHDDFYKHWSSKILNNETVVKKTILLNEQVAGNIVSWQDSGKRYVGFWIGKAYWGKGIITEAIKQMVEYGFKTYDITEDQ